MYTVQGDEMQLPDVAVASLGGTITMTPDGAGNGVVPSLGAADLIAAVPALEKVATLEATTLASLPGASLAFSDVLAALDWADGAVTAGADGVVLIQGTDTLEETSYLLDLHWPHPEPLVVTGAMRAPTAPGADGPANLLAAVRTAAAAECRSLGALVVMNDEVHAAARVRKAHASDPAAFRSPVFGPVAVLREGAVVPGNTPCRWPHLPTPGRDGGPRVAMINACLGDDGALLRLACADGFDGAVVAAFGAGHVSAATAAAIEDVIAEMTVVFATRTGAGSTLSSTYAFRGSETDLVERGAVPAGWLDPHKARLLLWSLLATGSSRERVRDEFARRGGAPGGPSQCR
jgi:L-asparaginase